MAYKVAIIGAGIGREHLAAYRQLPGRFSVAYICDLDTARAYVICDGDKSIQIVEDLQTVLDDATVDLVDVCLPPHLHFEVSKRVLQAGKHVVCEKPLVPSLALADQLIDVAARARKQLFPVFQYRYGLGATRLQALIDAGLAGKPFVASLETQWRRDADYYDVPWRGTWDGEMGGCVLGHAIHNHDYLNHFMGAAKSISAMTSTRVNDIETEDCAAISFELESGALATSSITLGAADDTTRIRMCFEGLTATSDTLPYAPAAGQWQFQSRGNTSQDEIDEIVNSIPNVPTGFIGFFDAVADALDGKKGREVTLHDGRRSLELVTAIYLAAHKGARVKLPLKLDPRYKVLSQGWSPKAFADLR